MPVSDKFNFDSRQKMKKMIELSSKEGLEYFTIIKNDYSLGEITKGKKGYCEPKPLIKSDKQNVIGAFHTHPHNEDFFNYTEDDEEPLELITQIMNLTTEEKDKLRIDAQKNIVRASASMSPLDIRFSVAYGLTLELIGTTDRESKPIVFCYELYNDSKERIQEEIKKIDENMKKICLPVFKKWLNNQESDNMLDYFQESLITLLLHKLVIKEESEIILC